MERKAEEGGSQMRPERRMERKAEEGRSQTRSERRVERMMYRFSFLFFKEKKESECLYWDDDFFF